MHRMTELFGRLSPGVDLDRARADLRAVHAQHREGTSRGVSDAGRLSDRCGEPARPDHLAGANDPAGAARRFGARLHRRVLERRESDPGAVGSARRRAVDSRRARRRHRRAAKNAARGEPAALRRRRRAGDRHRAADGGRPRALRRALFRSRERRDGGCEPALGRHRARGGGGRAARVRPAPAIGRIGERSGPVERQRADHDRHQSPPARVRRHTDRRVVRAARRRRHAHHDAPRAAAPADRIPGQRARRQRAGRVLHAQARRDRRVLQGSDPAHLGAARRGAGRARHRRAVARSRVLRRAVHGGGLPESQRRRGSAGAVPHRLAGILLVDRRSDHRRPRLQRRRPPRRREGGHRQPEPRAADVPEHGRRQSPDDVDRSGDEVHRREHETRDASSASFPTSTTSTSCRARR